MIEQLANLKRGIYGIFNNLFESIPSIPSGAEKIVLVKSIKGENIYYYKIGKGSKKVIFVGGIHGNEVGTVKLMQELINLLSGTIDYREFCFYLIPCLNIDGYEMAKKHPGYFSGGKTGRFNANNVDLNRNFPTTDFQSKSVWRFGKNWSQSKEVFCGNAASSEPENNALCELILKENVKIFVAFHNAGSEVMENDHQPSKELAKIFSQATGYKYVTADEWKQLGVTGTAKKWCDENNITYLEIEGNNRWNSDWSAQ